MRLWIEVVSGLAAGVLGLAGLAYAVYGPSECYASSSVSVSAPSSAGSAAPTAVPEPVTTSASSSHGCESLAQSGLPSRAVDFLIAMAVCLGCTVVGAFSHALWGLHAGLFLLWFAAVALVGGAILTVFSIGAFLLPAAGAALIAAITSTGRQTASAPPPWQP